MEEYQKILRSRWYGIIVLNMGAPTEQTVVIQKIALRGTGNVYFPPVAHFNAFNIATV
jgi:hypothetical protein